MSKCKKCGEEVVWKEKPGGGFFPPENRDGSRHDCDKKPTGNGQAPGIIGRLDSYCTTSATFKTRSGSKTYAITGGISQEWKTAGFLLPADNHLDVWMEFTTDKNNFIQPDYHTVQKPAWAAEGSDPTGGKITTPSTTSEKAKAAGFGEATHGPGPAAPSETIANENAAGDKRLADNEAYLKSIAKPAPSEPCTSPDTPAPQPSAEDLVRQAMKLCVPSDRVGYRISLAGMVNSVIEMEKMSSDAPKTYDELEADVKKKALALFLWCDGLTTQNIRRGA
jgi:hypothetical protein